MSILIRYIYCLLLLFFIYLPSSFVHAAYADTNPVINEALIHPSGDNKEWVEFYTTGTDLTNYWVDDDTDFVSDSGSSSKKQMTALVQGTDSHYIVFELPSSIFNNDEDTIALFTPQGQLVDSYHYTSDPGEDITIGRTPDATGSFAIMDHATRGSANSIAKPTPTPTPEPTEKPTKEPTPSKTSSPTNDLTITDIPEVSEANKNSNMLLKQPASLKARPTSILGIATKEAEKKTPSPIPTVMVQGSSTSTMPMVLVSFGGLFFLSCGILIYLKKRGIWN